ncbi:unnamed protein product [Prorocentrum cordatum]|uniref:Uncharacterized protein n=1 Tax=Prorocentrum cordatum TaxID=2364126 RepID=A0ABN9Q4F9_9DINO|nr:unnamed protein product [Polarella glacialis]
MFLPFSSDWRVSSPLPCLSPSAPPFPFGARSGSVTERPTGAPAGGARRPLRHPASQFMGGRQCLCYVQRARLEGGAVLFGCLIAATAYLQHLFSNIACVL